MAEDDSHADDATDAAPERTESRVALIGGIVALISGPVSLFGGVYAIFAGAGEKVLVAEWTLTILIAVTFGMLVYLAFSYHNRGKRLVRYKEKSDRRKNLLDRNRKDMTVMAEISRAISDKRAEVVDRFSRVRRDDDISIIQDKSIEYFDFVLSNLAELFSTYTGERCALCIKILRRGDEDTPYVQTFRRDHLSQGKRKAVDLNPRTYDFKYDANTAFLSILNPEEEDFWSSNDLKDLETKRLYTNRNEKWTDFYNATAVNAIRRPATLDKNGVTGFLCVDNFVGEFEPRFTRSVLATAANGIYHIYRIYSYIAETPAQGASNAEMEIPR